MLCRADAEEPGKIKIAGLSQARNNIIIGHIVKNVNNEMKTKEESVVMHNKFAETLAI